jgi:hypothetical protein
MTSTGLAHIQKREVLNWRLPPLFSTNMPLFGRFSLSPKAPQLSITMLPLKV